MAKPRSSDQTDSHRFAAATSWMSSAFAAAYGASTPIRTPPGAPDRSAPASSSAASMLCRAISSCAFAVNASASAG